MNHHESSGAPSANDILCRLRKRVLSLKPGTRLPTVRELMHEYGVSQSLVSQAFAVLKQEGTIDAHVGRGTFVTAKSCQTVLWVCGIDLYHGEISSYYTHHLRLAKEIFARYGLELEPAWLSNFRAEDAEAYCRPESASRYTGYFFLGCREDHHLLRFVAQQNLPYACVAYEGGPARRVYISSEQIAELTLGHLHEKGIRQASIMCEDWPFKVFREQALPLGMTLEQLPFELENRWMSGYHRAGYISMSKRLGEGPLPPAIFIQDDMLAMGATRALLEHCTPEKRCNLELLIASSLQAMVPMGLPVTYLVTDIADMVEMAVGMLLQQLKGTRNFAEFCVVPCQLVKSEGIGEAMAVTAVEPSIMTSS